jgi:hypothetical protein
MDKVVNNNNLNRKKQDRLLEKKVSHMQLKEQKDNKLNNNLLAPQMTVAMIHLVPLLKAEIKRRKKIRIEEELNLRVEIEKRKK